MAKFLRRPKSTKIFEDGPASAQTVSSAQPATTTAQTAQTAQPTQQPATTQPAPQQTAQTQLGQQPQQAVQPAEQQQADPKADERKAKVTECINKITEVVKQNNPYALLAYNVPDTMMAMVPGFKDDQNSKDTIAKWDAFKKNPTAEGFNAVIDAFTLYGNGGGQQQQAQPVAPQQNQPAQPANTQAATAATTAQQEAELHSFDFSKRLNESLANKRRISDAIASVKNYRL